MESALDTGSITWLLVSAALVLFMTPGLALFYGGMVRGRNVLNMLMMNLWCLLIVPVVFVAVGYSLAYHGTGGFIGNLDFAGLKGLSGLGEADADTVETLATVIFLCTFAAITPALISGAVADRMKFSAWAIFVPLWSLLVYTPVAYWIYGADENGLVGWLGTRGSLDFAGGTVIHVNAGIAALAAVMVLGKRTGWPREGAPPHSLPLVVLGTGILWFGWFGFNAGSALEANGVAVQAFINTFLGAAAGGLGWLLVERLRDGHFTTLGAASGIVAGLVAITPGAGFVDGLMALPIGLAAGLVCAYAVRLKFKFGFDDALDVVGVHFVGGLVGSLLLGLLAADGGGIELFGEQLLANAVTIVYSFVVSFGLFKLLDKVMGIRVSEEDEANGLDVSQHAETAYTLTESASIGR